MPIYEFVCTGCQARFERLRPVGQDAGVACPACGAAATRAISLFSSPRGGRSAGPVVSGVRRGGCAPGA